MTVEAIRAIADAAAARTSLRLASQPVWSPVDEQTGDLLDLLADDATVSTDHEWRLFVESLRTVATGARLCGEGRTINPNRLRRMVRGNIKPSRIGAFTRRAVLDGLVEYTGQWVVSDDTEGKNAGKPCRELRWIGGAQ